LTDRNRCGAAVIAGAARVVDLISETMLKIRNMKGAFNSRCSKTDKIF